MAESDFTKEDRQWLLSFKETVDYDGIKVKEQIKQVLLNNKYIIHVLNNKELEDEEAEPSDYFGINILPYYLISPTQTNVQNFICYTVGYKAENRYNSTVKTLLITFVILCEQKDIIDEDTSVSRTDLLAALLQDQFNYTNFFGRKAHLVSDMESVVDNSYACRTLIYEQDTDNNLVRTKNGIPQLTNKEIRAKIPEPSN
jgi:hypothetical protein